MALKSTVFKVQLSVSNISLNHYQDYSLTLARHPSESDDRLACRLLAFALHADQDLTFGKGISVDDEPDIWLKSLDDSILRWIDLGQPDEKRLRQACGRADQVNIYCYKIGAAVPWWNGIKSKAQRLSKLNVSFLKTSGDVSMGELVERSMQLNCTIDDCEILLSNESAAQSKCVNIEIQKVK